MSFCKTCGKKYSKWTTPVSARGVCRNCFESELNSEREAQPEEEVSAAQVAPTEKRHVPIRITSFIPRTRSKVVFVLVMSCYSFTLSAFIGTWARTANIKNPPPAFYLRGDAGDVVGLLLVAPLIESLILIGAFELLQRAHAPAAVQVFAAALFVSETHVWPWWPHAVIVLPAFCIDAAAYAYWRRRASWKVAFGVLVSIHALSNVIPTLSAIGRAMRHA
jgi:hypothetical protein